MMSGDGEPQPPVHCKEAWWGEDGCGLGEVKGRDGMEWK